MCCVRLPSGPEAVGAGREGKERFGESHIRPEEPSPPHLQKISQKERSFRGEREILREGAQSLTICRQNSRKARRLHAFKRAGKDERSPRHALGKSCFMPKWGGRWKKAECILRGRIPLPKEIRAFGWRSCWSYPLQKIKGAGEALHRAPKKTHEGIHGPTSIVLAPQGRKRASDDFAGASCG